MKMVNEHSFDTLETTEPSSALMWESGERSTLQKTPIFNLNRIHRKSQDGREGDFVEIESPQWVNIVPVFRGTDGVERFVMVRQYRHGSESVTIEFPAGLVDEGEDPVQAALREMEEETGIRVHKIKEIGCVNPNSAYMSTRGHFYLAEELEELGTRHFDANEQIDTVTIEVSEVLKSLGTGAYDNGVMCMSAFFYMRERNKGFEA